MNHDNLPPLPECSGLAGYTADQMHAYARAALAAAPAQPAPAAAWSDVVSDGGMDPRNAALQPADKWRDTVDDMLSVCHMVASDSPRESIDRLINWHVSVHMDPLAYRDTCTGEVPLYTAPPAPQTLTDEQIDGIARRIFGFTDKDRDRAFARAVIAAAKGEKP